MKTYSQVEGILYSHYQRIKNKIKYESALCRTRERIKTIEQDLRNCSFKLSADLQSMDYARDMVIASVDNSSSMEKCLIREESKLERELQQEVRYKLSLKRKIRYLQKEIDNIEIILDQLPLRYLPFIETLYRDKLTYRGAGDILHCDHKTIFNNKNEIITNLMKMLWFPINSPNIPQNWLVIML